MKTETTNNNNRHNNADLTPEETIFDNGSSFFDSMINDIDHAEHEILLESYIFNQDALATKVSLALQKAAEKGVSVKVLVDGCGSPNWGISHAKALEKSGAKTKVYHPFPWQIWNWSRSILKAPWIIRWIYLLPKVNRRNHRKICLIDNNIVFIGSINITKQHLLPAEGGDNWRDTAVRITNVDTSYLRTALINTWGHRTIKERLRDTFIHIKTDPIFRLNHSRHRRRILYKQLLKKIATSKKRIWITNAYFIPDNVLLRKLSEAAKRNIDVRILLSKKTDLPFPMTWASGLFLRKLLSAGIRIFEYTPSILHAKSIIIDDWILIGSTNLNHRSLLHDLEIDIRLSTNNAKNIVKHLFLSDLLYSQELSLKNWKQRQPWYKNALGKFILIAKYWI